MALKQSSSEALRRPWGALRIGFPLVALASLGLGYVGFRDYLARVDPESEEFGQRVIDLIYYDLQLFVLGSDPLQTPGPYNLALDTARFTAPTVTLYAFIETVRFLLSVEFGRFRARRATGHAIVCGGTPLAGTLTRRLQADGVEVVEICSDAEEFAGPRNRLRIVGDPRDPAVLTASGLHQAAMVYACDEDSVTNIAIASAIMRTIPEPRRPLLVYSLVADAELCSMVQAYFLGLPKPSGTRLDFFNIDHIAARRFFADDHPVSLDGEPPHILVAGTDGFAQAAIVEAARLWRAATPADVSPLTLTLVGPRATSVATALRHSYPFLDACSDLRPHDGTLLALLLRGELAEAPDCVLISYDYEEEALRTAMTAEQHWRGKAGAITVRLDGALVGIDSGTEGLGSTDTGLRVFSAVSAAGDPDLIRDDMTERIARVLHDRYLLGRRRRGEVDPGPAMVSWDALPPRLRNANRSNAEDIGNKLAAVGFTIIPRHTDRREESFERHEVEQLAQMEHDRWCREHFDAGWEYGPHRDELRRHHPGLRDWAELPVPMQLRNYDLVGSLPVILRDAGFQLIRKA